MKRGFYTKLAITGIKKNKKLYIPYILTCAAMVMMFYIIASLADSPVLNGMLGSETVIGVLSFGTEVIAIFSVIFLFYTNSFLIRKRKKEFGLYNILGMGKKNISVILLNETVILYLLSITIGLFFGIVFSKLAELALLNVLQEDISYIISISVNSILKSAIIYATVFALIFLNALRQIHLSNPINLLRSENVGEKPPKANWVMAVIGLIILCVAYYLSFTIESPLIAMMTFFMAVVMVIIATYILFISGSVTFCRLLQKKKKYYYKPNHFVSVSSMVYRMKRNGAGLASICILSTMVLVTLSSTVSMYIGLEDSVKQRAPQQIIATATYENLDSEYDHGVENLKNIIEKTLADDNAEASNILEINSAKTAGLLTDNYIETNSDKSDTLDALINYANIYQVYFLPLSEYNRVMSAEEVLNDDEALVFDSKQKFAEGTITVGELKALRVKKTLSEEMMFEDNVNKMSAVPSMYIIVTDIYYKDMKIPLDYSWYYGFDTDVSDEEQINIKDEIYHNFFNVFNTSKREVLYDVESSAGIRSSYKTMYGGFFFLGIILSLVFIFGAVLIIYYKQISEGYEDQSRFDIMQKVGMTKCEIRKSINSQILTVFFMPLITAGLHLIFAFPMIDKILELFDINNFSFIVIVTICCFLAFTVFYALVYRITSNAYYSIVSKSSSD